MAEVDGGSKMRVPLHAAVDEEAAPSAPFERLLQYCAGINQEEERRAPPSMQWKDLTFRIGDKEILKGVTGCIRAGRLTGVLGPSGSGKSTLLNVLAGRQRTNARGMALSGEVCVSGAPISPSDFRSNIAYVMQEDSLLATETPRECLRFSAYLRLPRAQGGNHEALVDLLLSTLQLEKCADTVAGSALVKGISGGERKRTSVGIELITNPRVLFLDEPLSGLDSYAAYTLVAALKKLAAAGVLVFCSVHQPSSEIFDMFDDAVFLHDGRVAYHGPVSELPGHFEKLGFPCKPSFNPADHVMFLMQKESAEAVGRVKERWLAGALHGELLSSIEDARAHASGPAWGRGRAAGVGPCSELAVLMRRELRGTLRNRGVLGARFGMSLFLGGLYSWLFAGSASGGDGPGAPNCRAESFDGASCASDFQAHYGTLVSLSIMAMMGSAQPVLLTFPSERAVFLREYAARQYRVAPYFLSKTLAEMPVVLVGQVLTFLVAYWIMGLHGSFAGLVAITWALGVASSSLALVIGCGVASGQKALQLAPLALIPQMLFSGLFLPVEKIPLSLRWVEYLCPLRYAINLLTQLEFSYIRERLGACAGDPRREAPGDLLRQTLMEKQGVRWGDRDFDVVMMVALFVGFRLLASVLLWRKGKYVY